MGVLKLMLNRFLLPRREIYPAIVLVIFAAGTSWASSPPIPTALRPVLHRILAKDAGIGHAINRNGCARLSRQVLTACFDTDGAHFRGADAPALTLHLAAWGRGGQLSAVHPVKPSFKDNRVRYAYNSLNEWWRVLPTGFEQGFTLGKRPAGQGDLVFALSANHLTDRSDSSDRDDTVTWGKLRYGRLVVTDANGRRVPAILLQKGDHIFITVNDNRAVYPITIDPLVWLWQEVTASGNLTPNSFGVSVAISGTTALIGDPFVTVNGNQFQGAVFVFTESSNGTWHQTQTLTASDGLANVEFGSSVALVGTKALIGAPAVDAANLLGAAYVFTESGGTWAQTAKLVGNNIGIYSYFGSSVAIDGTTAMVGADGYTVNNNQGSVYVFNQSSSGAWSQTQELNASGSTAYDGFGTSIAIDGSNVLVGAVGDSSSPGPGAAYLFAESGGTWTQTAKLVPSDSSVADGFGSSVALKGNTALIGANHWDSTGQGAAYVFTGSSTNWSQATKLTASDGAANDGFGDSVALDGTTALIGASGADINGMSGQGAAYVFIGSGSSWTQSVKLLANDNALSVLWFGKSVAINGAAFLIGAPDTYTKDLSQQPGAAYFFTQSNIGLAISAPQSEEKGTKFTNQIIATNNAGTTAPAVIAAITVPSTATYISATSTQGNCSNASNVVTCNFGPVNGNAGTATAYVTLKAIGRAGDTIKDLARVTNAAPTMSASAGTTITKNLSSGSSGGGGFSWLTLCTLLGLALMGPQPKRQKN